MTDVDRRNLIALGAVAGAGVLVSSAQAADAPAAAAPSGFAPKPLPIDPAAVPGLSEKLLRSHYDNNYTGAVKRLGAIRAAFAALDPATAANFTINGLKREELVAWNSMIIHEVYFASLGTGHPSPGAALGQAIERDFGSHARWAAEFSGMGKALGGGSGWVLLTYSPHDHRLVNQWAADHTMALAGATPILALDMYEHAYAMDYGAKAAAYVDAYMKVTDWASADAAYAKLSA